MWSKLQKAVRWSTLALMGLLIIFVSRDSYLLNPAQRAATQYTYDLVAWEATNFLGKWVHKLHDLLPWNDLSDDERLAQVVEYFLLGEDAASIRAELAQTAAEGQRPDASTARSETELEQVNSLRESLRKDVEETLESTISSVVSDIGLGSFGGFLFPPVDIRLTNPPNLLVTSPRDRIRRTHDVLLDSGISLAERESIEAELLDGSDLSALVIGIGGVATYPASLPNDRPLHSTLRTAAHEWLHHYLFFRPLGQNMFDSDDMQTLNETAADIAGREIGDRTFQRLGGTIEADGPADAEDSADGSEFNFDAETRETRRRVDEILAEGRVEDAEAYMEARRRLFVENGIHIRKLNQAYFAFYGTYAENASSVSPIGDQLHSFRALSPDVGSFVRDVSRVSSYADFLERLAGLETRQAPTP